MKPPIAYDRAIAPRLLQLFARDGLLPGLLERVRAPRPGLLDLHLRHG